MNVNDSIHVAGLSQDCDITFKNSRPCSYHREVAKNRFDGREKGREKLSLSLSLLWERERERQEEERARQKETRLENRINAGAKATPFQRTRRDAFSLHSASGRQLTLVGNARNSFPLRFFPCLTCLRKSCAVRDRLVGPMRGNREETRGVRKGRGNKVSTNGAEGDEHYASINEAKYRSLALVAAARMQF